MNNQVHTTRELQDRVNALEAICKDLLTITLNNPAQAQIKFDDYRIKNTQAAIEQREAEAKAKQLRENYAAATLEFRDRASTAYWSLVFMTEKQREQTLKEFWNAAISGLALPEDAQRPVYPINAPTEEELMERRAALNLAISRVNTNYENDKIKGCEQSIQDFTKANEAEQAKHAAEIKRKDKLTEAERDHQLRENEQYYFRLIKKHIQQMNRQITSAKTTLKCLEDNKAELGKVNKALAKLLSQ